jgi:hypothetical protein
MKKHKQMKHLLIIAVLFFSLHAFAQTETTRVAEFRNDTLFIIKPEMVRFIKVGGKVYSVSSSSIEQPALSPLQRMNWLLPDSLYRLQPGSKFYFPCNKAINTFVFDSLSHQKPTLIIGKPNKP